MHPKVIPLFLIIRITKVYYLDYDIILCSMVVMAIKMLQYSWTSILFFLHTLQVSRYTTHILLQSKWKFILKTSPVTVLLNSFPGSNILHISQLLCPEGKFPLSPSSFSLILDLTNLSCNVFGLWNATWGCFGNRAFNDGDFSIKRWADFKTLNTIFNAAWKVRTNVLLFFWCFFYEEICLIN